MTAKILITGAAGTVGRNIVRNLLERGIEVRAGVHTPDKVTSIEAPGVEPVHLEFKDFSTIDTALQGIQSLFLITPFAREQVEYARRMIDRAVLFGVEHVTYLSIAGAEREPGTQFTRWHRRIEKYLQNCTIAYTILRPFPYMQNFLRFIQPSDGFFYLPLDHALVNFIDIRDVASVAARILLSPSVHDGNIYELSGNSALSIDSISQLFTSALGTHIGYIPISEQTALHVLECNGTPLWLASGIVELFSLQRSGMFSSVTPVVEEITGKKPNSFELFIHDHLNLFKAIIHHEPHNKLADR